MRSAVFESDEAFRFETLRSFSHAAYGGSDFGEVLATAQKIEPGNFDSWHDEWLALAERIADEARRSEKRGHRVSARDSFLRASNYYRMAEFFLPGNPADPRITIAFDLSVACFRSAAALFDPCIEPVQIPFEGTTLPGYFYRGSSLIEYLVQAGQQVFAISWRNPRVDGAAWGMDTYGEAILDALGAIDKICEIDRTLLLAACSGGIITSMLLGHLAARGRLDRIAGLGLLVTVLDQATAGLPAAFVSKAMLDRAAASSARKGYLDGATLAELFAWLRPGDLIWNYWVNNYRLGREPPAFDILSWNADRTRMSAALHRDFLTVCGANQLITPGSATMMGTPVDLSAVRVDNYVVAGVADHLCPWQNCYQSTQLLGGDSRFVLSTSGHIAAIVNPPSNPKAGYRVGDEKLADAGQWMQTSGTEQGSWWNDYVGWLTERGGPQKPSPAELGTTGLAPLADAPGTYVFES